MTLEPEDKQKERKKERARLGLGATKFPFTSIVSVQEKVCSDSITQEWWMHWIKIVSICYLSKVIS